MLILDILLFLELEIDIICKITRSLDALTFLPFWLKWLFNFYMVIIQIIISGVYSRLSIILSVLVRAVTI